MSGVMLKVDPKYFFGPGYDGLPGTFEFAARHSYLLQDAAIEWRTDRLVDELRMLFASSANEAGMPWNLFPDDKPFRRADLYIERITGKTWTAICPLVESFDRKLAEQISSHCSAGQGTRTDLLTSNGSKSNDSRATLHGNTKSYTLNRLRREFPKLFERVIAGEITANAAAIEAGFRPHLIAVAKKPCAFVHAIRNHLSKDDQQRVVSMLSSMLLEEENQRGLGRGIGSDCWQDVLSAIEQTKAVVR